ncbi:MAG TPA: acetyl-CoA carboxylase biotin carboxylase subunit [Verrucomicrobiae bacterium]|nr:acetyl-CoA carboxylase biotin carboxylase subunit [Verrucomicrobiae bacterium]
MTRFTKVLVANRGEIAVRVIRGAKHAGYRTVAVYSDADADAMHVHEADEAVRLGPAPAKESYLCIDKILAAAQASGAQAIHPGYGFLSENAGFSKACKDAGLVFIGPDAPSIEAMGSKSAAKERMLKAKVPCVPGYQGTEQSDDQLLAHSRSVGLPVMIKAAAGGGGRGMRLVEEDSKLLEAIKSARSEAANAFGSGELLVEKAVVDGRHVEIQVFGDRHGNVIFLGERDCSIQRRNQKVVEEAPSPAVDDKLRRSMGEAAVAAAKAVNYVGAGTVEFLLGRDKQFYFLEMNTRLQVEHPVTELVYGVDLVEWQLRVAQGEKLPLTQDEVLARRKGWAIEVRLCAEDPAQNYLPQTGSVLAWREPTGAHLRTDTYLRDGIEITPFYDSMQAKIIAWGETREDARTRLVHALEDTLLLGVTSNRDYLLDVLRTEAFASGDFSTAFVGKYFPQERLKAEKPSSRQFALVAVAAYLDAARALLADAGLHEEYLGWHNSHETPAEFKLKWRDYETVVDVQVQDGRDFHCEIGAEKITVAVQASTADGFDYRIGDRTRSRARYARQGDQLFVCAEGRTLGVADRSYAVAETSAAGSDGRITAHSDGKIVAVHVKPGDTVSKGQTLVVLEAMKMEFQLATPVDGTVAAVSVAAGTQVKGRQLLVQIKPAP